MKTQSRQVDDSILPDKQLADVAATLVFIYLGPRALWALVDACVEFTKRQAAREAP